MMLVIVALVFKATIRIGMLAKQCSRRSRNSAIYLEFFVIKQKFACNVFKIMNNSI